MEKKRFGIGIDPLTDNQDREWSSIGDELILSTGSIADGKKYKGFEFNQTGKREHI